MFTFALEERILNPTPSYIDVKTEGDNVTSWQLTVIYGEFKWDRKFKTWQRMRDLNENHNLPWVLVGDLNRILFLHEKRKGSHDLRNICVCSMML